MEQFSFEHNSEARQSRTSLELPSRGPQSVNSTGLRCFLKDLIAPLTTDSTPLSQSEITSPDRCWTIQVRTDQATGWSRFSVQGQKQESSLSPQFPPSRSTTGFWLKDSSAFIFTGYPKATLHDSRPLGSEQLLVFNTREGKVESIPLPYPDTSRVEVTLNDEASEILVSIREGNNRFRKLLALSLTCTTELIFESVSCSPSFNPLQSWKVGYIGISDGALGRRALEYIQRGAAPITLVEETESILRAAIAGPDGFLLSYFSNGEHQIIFKPFDTRSDTHEVYRGELVLEKFVPTEDHIQAIVSRIDCAPIEIPCTKRAFEVMERALPKTYGLHEHREFTVRDGVSVPVDLYFPRTALSDRLLVCTYGAWGVILDARFHALRSAWLELGGSLALIGVRGGGERGAFWHQNGQGSAKQTAIDDLTDVLTLFKRDEKLNSYRLVGYGYSAGATVIAAALARQPELLSEAVLEAGVYDMIHYDQFSFGAGWHQEFGDPKRDAATFDLYSPLSLPQADHGPHAKLLLVSGDNDQTVVPYHSRAFHQHLSTKWGSEASQLAMAEGIGHNLEAPYRYQQGSPSREKMIDILLKEITFLSGTDYQQNNSI